MQGTYNQCYTLGDNEKKVIRVLSMAPTHLKNVIPLLHDT